MESNDKDKETRDESSLETKDTSVDSKTSKDVSDSLDSTINKESAADAEKDRFIPKKGIGERIQKFTDRVNIYLLLFILILVLSGIAAFATYNSAKKDQGQSIITGQELSQEDLANLKTGDQQVGEPQQTLTIASNSVFNGRVLIRSDLDVAGTIRIGGALSLPGITVSGTSAFENVQIANNLSISGDAAVQGNLTVQQNLSVGGSASFSGQISAPSLSIDRLIINEDLQINRHIDAGGATPTSSRGSAVGGAGTVSVSGTDTAGTINLNFSSGSPAGVLANIGFRNSFAATPHIVVTPVGSTCASLDYFISRTTTGFTLHTASDPPNSGSCAFDYIAID